MRGVVGGVSTAESSKVVSERTDARVADARAGQREEPREDLTLRRRALGAVEQGADGGRELVDDRGEL